MVKAAEDPVEEVRKQATSVLKLMQAKGEKERVIEVARSRQAIKASIVKELETWAFFYELWLDIEY